MGKPRAPRGPKGPSPGAKASGKAKVVKAEEHGSSNLVGAVPYGVNFVRQDLRRGKRTSASKGGHQNSRQLNKKYGKDGRLKPKFSRAPEPVTGAPVTRRQEKAQRHHHQQLAALSRSSLMKFTSKREPRSFSAAMTDDLLASIQEDGAPNEVADERPPDVRAREKEDPLEANSESPWLPSKERAAGTYSGQDLTAVLQQVFGHSDFRPGQQEAILSVLGGHQTLLLLATGSGKSLCYQLPAYLLREEGLTLVVSPLISLMADQLMRLPSCLRGAVCSGQQSRDTAREVMRAVRARLVDVLFVSPERLAMWSFDGCGLPPIALACIDEAHCVSEWSHNFRPDYLRLNEYLVGSLGARRVLALTATATRPTVQSVCDILKLDTVVRSDSSFTVEELMKETGQPRVQRQNLCMDARAVEDIDFQTRELIKILRNDVNPSDSVVVYVWKRVTADQLAKQLRPYVKGGVNAYHGSMLPEARSAVQENFMSGKIKVVVATVAFGMGLDKPDIRTVVHFGLPKSLENYIQETGRCSRDGAPGKCIALVSRKDYQTMRWLESGGTGGGAQAVVVRRLLTAWLGDSGNYQRHPLSEDALASARAEAEDRALGSFQPYCVSFDEKEASREMNCSVDELHSVLAHLSRYAKGHVSLLSSFPTKLKLRFFRTDPAELEKVDPLLRKVLPLTKQVAGVFTLDTAKALATLGGTAGQLSNGLWQARGDEFSVEKADYGYMLAVLKPISAEQIEHWAELISSINVRARESAVEKLDAAFITLSKAAEASERQRVAEPEAAVPAADGVLSGLIDEYFAAVEEPSKVVAGSGEERRRMLSAALGAEYRTSVSMQARPRPAFSASSMPSSAPAAPTTSASEAPARQLHSGTVCATVTRLLLDPTWPDLPGAEVDTISHSVAQFLAGIGSEVLPARKWREHRFWGQFRRMGDFEYLEELVREAVVKFRRLKIPRTS